MFLSTSIRAALAGLLFLNPALAEQSSGEPDAGRDRPFFRAEVDQVVLYAAVYDEDGELVPGLTLEDFVVLEDGTEVDITYFGQDDVPSTSGIVMDKSGSMRAKQDLAHRATKLFLALSHPDNEHFLIMFDDDVNLEEDFTRDPEDIRDMLDNTVVGGGTALYDAIFLALEKAQKGSEAKKVVTVFTDGEDKDSYYRHEELLEKIARSNDVQLYVVALLDQSLSRDRGFFGVFKSQYDKVRATVDSISGQSGAKVYFPEELYELNDLFPRIASELRNQYRIAYITPNSLTNGGWRTIEVRLRNPRKKKLTIQAKKGYFGGPEKTGE